MSPELIVRLKRLLVLIPYVAQHEDGVPLKKVIEFAGYGSEEDFYSDLELSVLIGVPPGAPDDLIDMYVEHERVFVALPQAFTRPPRLSAVEATALIVAAEPLRGSTGTVLESAVARLREALPRGTEPMLDELVRSAAVESAPPSKWHGTLREAIEKRLEVEVDYWAVSNGSATKRTLHPRSVFQHRGRWYLAAWAPEHGEERLYRLDRVRDVRIGAKTFGEHPGDDSRYQRDVLYFSSASHPEVEAVFDKSLARLAVEQWGPLARKNADGSVSVVTRMASEAYAVSWAMGYAGRVRFARPAAFQTALEQRARQMLSAYAG